MKIIREIARGLKSGFWMWIHCINLGHDSTQIVSAGLSTYRWLNDAPPPSIRLGSPSLPKRGSPMLMANSCVMMYIVLDELGGGGPHAGSRQASRPLVVVVVVQAQLIDDLIFARALCILSACCIAGWGSITGCHGKRTRGVAGKWDNGIGWRHNLGAKMGHWAQAMEQSRVEPSTLNTWYVEPFPRVECCSVDTQHKIAREKRCLFCHQPRQKRKRILKTVHYHRLKSGQYYGYVVECPSGAPQSYSAAKKRNWNQFAYRTVRSCAATYVVVVFSSLSVLIDLSSQLGAPLGPLHT